MPSGGKLVHIIYGIALVFGSSHIAIGRSPFLLLGEGCVYFLGVSSGMLDSLIILLVFALELKWYVCVCMLPKSLNPIPAALRLDCPWNVSSTQADSHARPRAELRLTAFCEDDTVWPQWPVSCRQSPQRRPSSCPSRARRHPGSLHSC